MGALPENNVPFSARGKHKTKRNVFSNAYYLKQKLSPYWLYVSVVSINKALQNFQSVFTGQQYKKWADTSYEVSALLVVFDITTE